MTDSLNTSPVVTIIMATYNRSNVLAYAIRSVLHQTETDWELLVIGDHCTDDTETVVASFADSRIRFINLPENIGEQSGPNNVGLQQARSEFIAFLNHDDMWFPNHLTTCLTAIRESQADLVFGLGAISWEAGQILLAGTVPANTYHSAYFVPASSWVFRRSILAEVGLWRSYKTLWLYPSHDWLRRVYQKKKRIQPIRELTWLSIPSGIRINSYRDRQSHEHDCFYTQLTTNPAFKEQLLTQALMGVVDQTTLAGGRQLIWQGVKNSIKKRVMATGLTPIEIRFMWQYWRKGQAIHVLRKIRGLPKLNQ